MWRRWLISNSNRTHDFSRSTYYKLVQFYFVTAEYVTGSTAWIGRGLSCVCAQRRESDARLSFDLTPYQVIFVGIKITETALQHSLRHSFHFSLYIFVHGVLWIYVTWWFSLNNNKCFSIVFRAIHTVNWMFNCFHHDTNVSRCWVLWLPFYLCSSCLPMGSKQFVTLYSFLILHGTVNSQCWIFHFQEECLQRLQSRIDVPYDSSIPEHQVVFSIKKFQV